MTPNMMSCVSHILLSSVHQYPAVSSILFGTWLGQLEVWLELGIPCLRQDLKFSIIRNAIFASETTVNRQQKCKTTCKL